MVDLSEIARVKVAYLQNELDNQIINTMATNISLAVGLDVKLNEEKVKEWIKQAIEIETFSPEQIEDIKMKHLIEKKDKRIQELQEELRQYKEEVKDTISRLGESF